jgi:BON domain
MRNKRNRRRTSVATLAIASLIGGGMFAANVRAEPGGTTDSSNSASRENDSVNVTAEHHYNSPVERANDALLITEVKSALARDGVADGYPVAVDCDHGKILLSGVVKSARDAKHAGDIAAAAQGVTGVKNQLTWR